MTLLYCLFSFLLGMFIMYSTPKFRAFLKRNVAPEVKAAAGEAADFVKDKLTKEKDDGR